MADKISRISQEFKMILKIINKYNALINPFLEIPTEEYLRRQKTVFQSLKENSLEIGFVFSDEHYCGDIAYLGGTVTSIEQVAGVIGRTGFHIIAGLEGGYVAEQLAPRAHANVHKVELLQLADEKYPIEAERLENVIEVAAQKKISEIDKIALLTPKQVIPAAIV
jgi:hypothetical protein